MSVYLVVGGEEWRQFASGKGRADFTAWVDGLGDEYPLLAHLVEWGWSEDLAELEQELTAALRDSPPDDEVRETASGLLEALDTDAATVLLTDAIGGDDSPDEGWESAEDGQKHLGPGPHPSGSSQDVHGRPGDDEQEPIDSSISDDPELFESLPRNQRQALQDAFESTPLFGGDIIVAGVEIDRDYAERNRDIQRIILEQAERGIGLNGGPLEPGEPIGLWAEYGNYEPEQEPDMNEFLSNQFPVLSEFTPGTGFVLSSGGKLDLGHSSGHRDNDHRIVIPSEAARKRWGWPEDTYDNRSLALFETMKRARAARVHLSYQGRRPVEISLHFAHSPTSAQRRTISELIDDFDLEVAWDVTYNDRTLGGFEYDSYDAFDAIDSVFQGDDDRFKSRGSTGRGSITEKHISMLERHMGPGPHPSGSSQDVHGRPQAEHPAHPLLERVGADKRLEAKRRELIAKADELKITELREKLRTWQEQVIDKGQKIKAEIELQEDLSDHKGIVEDEPMEVFGRRIETEEALNAEMRRSRERVVALRAGISAIDEETKGLVQQINHASGELGATLMKLFALPPEKRIDLKAGIVESGPPMNQLVATHGVMGLFLSVGSPSDQWKGKVEEATGFLRAITGHLDEQYREGYFYFPAHHSHPNIRPMSLNQKDTSKNPIDEPLQFGIFMSPDVPTSVFVHEIAHHIEMRVPEINTLTRQFRDERIARAGTSDVKMKVFDPGYGDKEEGNPDDFGLAAENMAEWSTTQPDTGKKLSDMRAAYIGKLYDNGGTEILAVGTEILFETPIYFARHDPEFFKFVIGVLSGDLRQKNP